MAQAVPLAEATAAPLPEAASQGQPQEALSQQTMTIPAGAAIPAGYEVVADGQSQAPATPQQTIEP